MRHRCTSVGAGWWTWCSARSEGRAFPPIPLRWCGGGAGRAGAEHRHRRGMPAPVRFTGAFSCSIAMAATFADISSTKRITGSAVEGFGVGTVDWHTLAQKLGTLRDGGESGGSDLGRQALELIVGADALRAAVDYYIAGEP